MRFRFNLTISFIAMGMISYPQIPTAYASQPRDRSESATSLIEEAGSLKETWRQHCDLLEKQIFVAEKLNSEAKQLRGKVSSQNTNLRGSAMGGQRFKLDLKQFQDGLAKFQKHRDLYNLHLEEFEREMQKAAAGRDKLESHCSRFSDHVEKFHVPGARPPHICLDLQTQERDLQQMNARYLEGQRRLSEAESQLASSEAALKAAAAERAKIGERLQKQAAVERVERTYGTMLLKEYEQLKLEWKILAGQKKDLGQ